MTDHKRGIPTKSSARWRRGRAAAAIAAVTAAMTLGVPVARADSNPTELHRSDTNNAAAHVQAVMVKRMVDELGISHAEAVRRLRAEDNKAASAERLTDRLGGRAAGAYIDEETGRLFVNVTTQGAARQVRSTSAHARVVDDPLAALKKIKFALAERLVNGGTLEVDVETNIVVATVPDDRHDPATAAFVRAVRSYGDAAVYDAHRSLRSLLPCMAARAYVETTTPSRTAQARSC